MNGKPGILVLVMQPFEPILDALPAPEVSLADVLGWERVRKGLLLISISLTGTIVWTLVVFFGKTWLSSIVPLIWPTVAFPGFIGYVLGLWFCLALPARPSTKQMWKSCFWVALVGLTFNLLGSTATGVVWFLSGTQDLSNDTALARAFRYAAMLLLLLGYIAGAISGILFVIALKNLATRLASKRLARQFLFYLIYALVLPFLMFVCSMGTFLILAVLSVFLVMLVKKEPVPPEPLTGW